MKKRRILAAIGLSLALATGLTACGNSAAQKEAKKDSGTASEVYRTLDEIKKSNHQYRRIL